MLAVLAADGLRTGAAAVAETSPAGTGWYVALDDDSGTRHWVRGAGLSQRAKISCSEVLVYSGMCLWGTGALRASSPAGEIALTASHGRDAAEVSSITTVPGLSDYETSVSAATTGLARAVKSASALDVHPALRWELPRLHYLMELLDDQARPLLRPALWRQWQVDTRERAALVRSLIHARTRAAGLSVDSTSSLAELEDTAHGATPGRTPRDALEALARNDEAWSAVASVRTVDSYPALARLAYVTEVLRAGCHELHGHGSRLLVTIWDPSEGRILREAQAIAREAGLSLTAVGLHPLPALLPSAGGSLHACGRRSRQKTTAPVPASLQQKDGGRMPRSENAPSRSHEERTTGSSWQVRATKVVGYEVRSCDRVFDVSRRDLLEGGGPPGTGPQRRLVVVDSAVDQLYGSAIREYFDHHDVVHRIVTMDAGEQRKEIDPVLRVAEELDAFGIDRRREPVIVVGGGVLMDIVGFAAGMYRRGTPFIRVPTTLIGLADAGVGVKNGVNFNGRKNRLGTYAEAGLTLLDRMFLSTLPERHIVNGMAEILKIALIKDAALFGVLESHGKLLVEEKFQGLSPEGERAAVHVLDAAVDGMIEELEPNLWEHTLERCVDYGHTFSPTLEMRALPSLLHGEAVSVDMAFTTALAARRGLVDEAQCRRVFSVMSALGLPTWNPLMAPGILAEALRDTVKHRDGKQRLPLPVGIGGVTFVDDVADGELAGAVALQRGIAAGHPPDPAYQSVCPPSMTRL
ncbi:sedoheptulose 7-phosphate cyclase [Amycolatopsis sp. NBC_00345]|uniref:sedoheptulose 7-phosphate cyclase n=1 Tax=Amycolatopsis sp. NBC_00345 TaxID=2975955 RepID=UPI002E254910